MSLQVSQRKKANKYSPQRRQFLLVTGPNPIFIRLQRGLKGPALPEAVVVHDDHLLSVALRL